MKRFQHIVLTMAIILLPFLTTAQVQEHNLDPRGDGKQMFNHLSIGGIIGTSGVGVDVAMPCTKYVTVRAGLDMLKISGIRYNFATNVANILTSMNVNNQSMFEALHTTDVELKVSPNMFNAHFIADIHPLKNSTLHLSAGFFVGNTQVLTVKNTHQGSYKFLNEANEYVQLYNETFLTQFSKVGVKFGDYIFTADKNGNIHAKMNTWALRPYIGLGMGRPFGRTNNCSVMVDAGCMFWGTPKVTLNHEQVIKTSEKNAGVLSTLSTLNFLPMIQVRIAGDLF